MNETTLTPEQIARSSLLSYIGLYYPKYQAEPMHKLIATALERVESGKIKRLLIFAPPQHGKSMLASEFFPAWALGRNPDWKIIAATFNQTRANEVGTVVRDQFRSSIYKAVFPECVVSPDTQSSQHVATLKRGHYYSIGLSGTGTGRGADLFLVDDPFKGREDAESKLGRKKVNEDFYAAVAYSRLRPGGRIIIINTRWQLEDLSGYVLGNFPFENWKVIDLKAIAEENDILGRKVGEALCPNMYPIEELRKMKRVQGTYNWESLYQQRPIPRSGGIIKYEWIEDNTYTRIPANEDVSKMVISWDTAYRANELNDPTAATVWQITKNGYYLIDVINKKLEFYKLIQMAKMLHEKYHPSAHLVEGRASGQTFIDELRRTTVLPVIEISTKNLDKHIRLDAVSGMFESGKVHLLEKASWILEAKDQLCLFPSHKYDDITDSVSQFLNWVNKPRYMKRATNNLYWK